MTYQLTDIQSNETILSDYIQVILFSTNVHTNLVTEQGLYPAKRSNQNRPFQFPESIELFRGLRTRLFSQHLENNYTFSLYRSALST